MSELESLFNQLADQRNREYTLYQVYGRKAENERDRIAKVVYQKLRDDSLSHLWLVEIGLKLISKKVDLKTPKLTALKIDGYDVSSSEKDIPIEQVDMALEEIEAASATFFSIFGESFPDPQLPRFFRAMAADERVHRELLKEVKAYKEAKLKRPANLTAQ